MKMMMRVAGGVLAIGAMVGGAAPCLGQTGTQTPKPATVPTPTTPTPSHQNQQPNHQNPPTTTHSPGSSQQPNQTHGQTQGQQPGHQQPQQPQPAQPVPVTPMAAPGAMPEWPKVTEGPYITRNVPKEWDLQVIVDLSSNGSVNAAQMAQNNTPFVFDSLTMVWPIVGSTSNSDPSEAGIQSWLRFDGHDVITGPFAKESTPDDPRPVLIRRMAGGELYPAGVMLGKWSFDRPGTQTRTVQLMITIPSTSSRTVLDSEAALKVDWPKGPWPEVAAACFQPQMFIDCGIDPVTYEMKMYNMKPIQDAVREWTNGNPKAISPLKLAKYLTFKVVHGMVPGKADVFYGGSQAILGLDLLGAPLAMETRQIGAKDMGTVLVACMREAGLPARLIYGYQAMQNVADGNTLVHFTNNDRFRCWVEFCLYDEEKKTINWIPIDYMQFRYTSNAMKSLDEPWNYIGTLQYAESMVPVALQAFPPTTVMGYGYPALWGWILQPGVPVNLGQSVTISASRAGTTPATTKPNQGNSQNPPNQQR